MDGRRALFAGDLGKATEAFARAEVRFRSADTRAHGLVARIASWTPLIGDDVDIAAALGTAGTHLAGGALEITDALADLPDGVGALAPSGGRLPIGSYTSLVAASASARAEAEAAEAALDAAPSTALLPPVLEARWTAEAQVDDVLRSFEAAELLLRGLPDFAGAGGPRRYLVLASNPAELRGTGGIWGAYAVVTLRGGRPAFSDVAPTQSLPDVSASELSDIDEDYRRNYDEFGGAGSWQNMNMTPDFPSAARAALANYEAGTGIALDGVIAADPFALEAMLAVTGSVPVPATGLRVDETNVVDLTTNVAYRTFTGSVERKEVLGGVATEVFRRFLSLEGRGLARIKVLAGAVADGHLDVYTRQPEFQRGLDVAGVAGSLVAPENGDVVVVAVNNGSASKIDYYATRKIRYDVTLGGDGEAIASLRTSIRNDAPTTGAPRYVLGPFADGATAGDQIPLWTTWCHMPCDLLEATRDGEPIGVVSGSEAGLDWYRDYRTIPAGQTGTLALSWRTEGVWEGNSSGGRYRLTLLGQPTLRPTEVTVTITAPAGTTIAWTSEPMSVTRDTATWHGELESTRELEVRFQAPVPLRWWRNVTRTLP